MKSPIKRIRPRRCQLSVPASSKKMIEKASSMKVDGVILDLEDSVAPDQKKFARYQIIDGLKQLDWKASSVSIRINATNTEWCHQDIIELVSNCSEEIATLIVPMVNTPNDLIFVETLIKQLAIKHSNATEIGLEGLIETVEGLSNVDEIAQSSEKLEALVLGMGDYAASQRMRINTIGEVSSEAGDIWQYPRYRLIVACHANGIHPIDGPYADIKDITGLKQDSKKTSLIGMMGKWAIHPDQVAPITEAFTPGKDIISTAKKQKAAYENGLSEGLGSVSVDGVMVDAANAKTVDELLALNELYEQADSLSLEKTETQ